MAYPGPHSGMLNMYGYSHPPTHYQQSPSALPPPPPLVMPQQQAQQQLPPISYQQQPQYGMHAIPAAYTANPQPPDQAPTPEDENEANDEAARNRPDILPVSKEYNGRSYVLTVVQQPERARMCGFGDKDRRPISPPPCIQLRIYDTTVTPHKEIDYSKIEDLSRYVVMVDLAHIDSLVEKNLVTHAAQSPSISTVETLSYPPTQVQASPPRGPVQNYALGNLPGYSAAAGPYDTAGAPSPRNGNPYYSNGNVSGEYARAYPQLIFPPATGPLNPGGYSGNGNYPPDPHRGSLSGVRQQLPGTLSRNLIGSLSGSAFKLLDLDDRLGLWFVFQDLSIRTEGWFRLKFTFFDLKDALAQETQPSKLAPMLACSYSRTFKVFSAKKFPGVIESTPLSKKFADQGIKIPIRKDSGKDGLKDKLNPSEKRKHHGSDDDDGDSDDNE
ncbi:hypothetical protein DV735_g1251, partial [Chaetothyriales sp. CBS 134920]